MVRAQREYVELLALTHTISEVSMQIGTRSSRGAATALLALLGGQLLLPPMAADAAAEDVTAGLVLRYDLAQTSGTTVTDSSGNGRDAHVGGRWHLDRLGPHARRNRRLREAARQRR